ncbi:MAG: hypothetical protein P1V29_06080 [Gammaproteobacteria bacterium]|nr:hypothetical protein [Gammaproteobacteria bacterium]
MSGVQISLPRPIRRFDGHQPLSIVTAEASAWAAGEAALALRHSPPHHE